jgi:hypothetical protein
VFAIRITAITPQCDLNLIAQALQFILRHIGLNECDRIKEVTVTVHANRWDMHYPAQVQGAEAL